MLRLCMQQDEPLVICMLVCMEAMEVINNWSIDHMRAHSQTYGWAFHRYERSTTCMHKAKHLAKHLAFIEAVVHSIEAVHSDLLTTQVNAYIMHIAYWLHRWMHIVAARLVWYYTTWRQSYCMRSILILQNRPPAVIQGTSSDAHRILARVSDQGEVEFMVMSLDWHN